jgi:hypothetical protein
MSHREGSCNSLLEAQVDADMTTFELLSLLSSQYFILYFFKDSERGVLALGCICTLYFKHSLNIFSIDKKIQKNMLCEVFNLYVIQVVSRKPDFSCELGKKDKISC